MAFGLAGVDGDNAAADGLGHVRAGIDRNDQDGCGPDVIEAQGIIREIRQGVENEHGLQHHRRAAENLDVDADDDAENFQKDTLGQRIVFGARDGIENAAEQADDTADRGRGQRKAERVEHTVQVHQAVLFPQNPDVLHELGELIHGVVSFHF